MSNIAIIKYLAMAIQSKFIVNCFFTNFIIYAVRGISTINPINAQIEINSIINSSPDERKKIPAKTPK